jgi:hypothetical protein
VTTVTTPATAQPPYAGQVVSETAVSSLLPPRVRTVIYLLTVVAAAVYAVLEADMELRTGVKAGYAGWNAFAAAVAASNTISTFRRT